MYSSFLMRPVDEAAGQRFMQRIEQDRRFKLKAEKEVDYYRKQTLTAAPIKWLGGILATMMSIGAVFAAMNTMYTSVGSCTREIGTLRVLQGAAPSPSLPMPPASAPMTPAPGQRAEDVMPTMADKALIQALRRKQMNQLFSAAGGSPMPQ